MMLYPPMADLVDKVGSRYMLVNVVAHRARQLAIKVLVGTYVIGVVALYALLPCESARAQVAVGDGVSLDSFRLDAHLSHLLVHHSDTLIVMPLQYRLQPFPCDGLLWRIAASTE